MSQDIEFWVDPESPYHKPLFAADKRFVFYCQSGWRSALTTKTVQDMGLPRVTHIGDGFRGWKDAGAPIEDIRDTSPWIRRPREERASGPQQPVETPAEPAPDAPAQDDAPKDE